MDSAAHKVAIRSRQLLKYAYISIPIRIRTKDIVHRHETWHKYTHNTRLHRQKWPKLDSKESFTFIGICFQTCHWIYAVFYFFFVIISFSLSQINIIILCRWCVYVCVCGWWHVISMLYAVHLCDLVAGLICLCNDCLTLSRCDPRSRAIPCALNFEHVFRSEMCTQFVYFIAWFAMHARCARRRATNFTQNIRWLTREC